MFANLFNWFHQMFVGLFSAFFGLFRPFFGLFSPRFANRRFEKKPEDTFSATGFRSGPGFFNPGKFDADFGGAKEPSEAFTGKKFAGTAVPSFGFDEPSPKANFERFNSPGEKTA